MKGPFIVLIISGSIPVTLTFQEALGKSVLLLPMGRSDDGKIRVLFISIGAHSINEKIDVRRMC